ncbi:MAG: SMP-30/gluconolactonase/LRE family protein [Luteibacter sp.]
MLSTSFEVHDERFLALVIDNVQVERLWTGARWCEGPVYVPAGRYLLFSDIPNDRMMRWDEATGTVAVFQQGCGYQNGHTLDAQGRVLACEHGGRRITRVEADGSLTVLASHFEGARFNSPNDIVVAADGGIWFTDPTYGIDSDYEGHAASSDIGASHLYRIDPGDGRVEAIGTDFAQPNGLAFSPDERRLYVVDSGFSHRATGPRHIRVFDVRDGRTLGGSHVLAGCDNGIYDGLRVDTQGNLWVGAGDGVRCLSPEGEPLGLIRLPETASNVAFGGPKRNRLFICATQSLYSVYLKVPGARRPDTHADALSARTRDTIE